MKTTTAVKPAASKKPATKKVDAPSPVAQIATALTREQVRAARYPLAAKQEAEKKAVKADKASAPATKAAPKAKHANTVPFVVKKAAAGATIHALVAGARPSKGAALFAHTHAVLTVLGLFSEGTAPVPQGTVATMIGQTALSYHRRERNFEDAPGQCIRLSHAGKTFFNNRLLESHFDTKLANAFVDMMLTGKIDSAVTGISQNNVYAYRA